jgi:hypothetical protein
MAIVDSAAVANMVFLNVFICVINLKVKLNNINKACPQNSASKLIPPLFERNE